MSTSEVPSPKGPAAVESVLLDLLDPENKPLLPQTLPLSPSMAVGSGGYNSMVQTVKGIKMALEEQLVLNLCDPELRGNVLVELSKKRVMFNDLAPLLWYSFGTIAALLQEIVSIYPALSPPTLSTCAANRACNALALLQTVAAHPETGTPFLEAGIPSYLFLFLNTTSKAKSFEYCLRITSLGVLGALVKVTLEHWSLYPIGNTWAVGLGPFLVILVLFSSGIQINSKQRKK